MEEKFILELTKPELEAVLNGLALVIDQSDSRIDDIEPMQTAQDKAEALLPPKEETPPNPIMERYLWSKRVEKDLYFLRYGYDPEKDKEGE